MGTRELRGIGRPDRRYFIGGSDARIIMGDDEPALLRLSRYEATLWRQAGRILYALETLDRRKPQERMRRFWLASEDRIEQR